MRTDGTPSGVAVASAADSGRRTPDSRTAASQPSKSSIGSPLSAASGMPPAMPLPSVRTVLIDDLIDMDVRRCGAWARGG